MNDIRERFNVKIRPGITATAMLATAALLAAGCTSNDPGSKSSAPSATGSTTIKVGLWGSKGDLDTITPVIKEFEQANPTIKVKVITGDCGISYAACKTLIAGGSMPDVFVPHIQIYNQAVNDGVLADLTADMANDNVTAGDFAPASLMKALVAAKDGKVYGLPMGFNVQSLYYNKAMFDQAKLAYPPADGNYTWDDVRSWAKKLTLDATGKASGEPGFNADKIKQYGFFSNAVYGIIQGWGPIATAYGAGVLEGDKGEDCTLDTPAAAEAFQLQQDMMYKDRSMVTPALQQEQPGYLRWISGQVAMQQGSHEQVGFVAAQNPSLKYDMAALPKGPAGNATLVQEHVWAAYSGSKHKDAAWTFVRYMSTTGSEKKQMGLIPAYKKAYEGPAFLEAPGEPEHLKEAQIDPLNWPLARVLVDPAGVFEQVFSQDGVAPAIDNVFQNKQPAATALKGTCEAVTKILSSR